jgi:hypothetical protein
MDSTVSPKVMTMEGKRVGAHSLVRNTLARSTLEVEGHVGTLGWGTRKIDKQVNYLHGLAQNKQQVG